MSMQALGRGRSAKKKSRLAGSPIPVHNSLGLVMGGVATSITFPGSNTFSDITFKVLTS